MIMKEIAPRITVDEKVRFGKPVVQGTRVAVTTVLGHLASGDTAESIAEEYGLSKEDVLACIAYALDSVEHEYVRAVP
jgi:uncharacterized protein (DUF433 family)